MVLPSRIWSLVIPTSVATVPPLELPQAAAMTRKATAAANRGPVLARRFLLTPVRRLLNSLGIGRQLSSCPFTGSPQPASQPGVRGKYQRSEEHTSELQSP